MFFAISKLIPPFVFPPGLQILMILAGLAVLSRRPRLGKAFICVGVLTLYLMSTYFFANPIVSWLENSNPATPAASAPQADAIVVLGNFLATDHPTRRPFSIIDVTDRLYKAVLLYRANKAPIVVLTGGDFPGPGRHREPQTIAAKKLLIEWGVPEQAIRLEGKSQNTHENASFSRALFPQPSRPRILLVTSALHENRSIAIFRREGFDVVPFPADYRTGWEDPGFPGSFLPSTGQLANTELALHELVGLFVYKLRGWA